MYSVKSKEFNHTGVLNLLKKEIKTNDSQARILKVMIKAGRPLRAFEIVEASNMNKTRIHNNLNDMLSKGSILVLEKDFNKFYFPQLFFLDPEIMGLLYEKLLPFIKIIHTNSDYSHLKDADNRISIIENFKILLRLFAFEIEDTESDLEGNVSQNKTTVYKEAK